MALGRDVGVELLGARREALAIVVVDGHATAGDQPGASLDQVPRRSDRELSAGRQHDGPARLPAVGQPDARQLVPSSVGSLVRHAARSLRQTAPVRNPL